MSFLLTFQPSHFSSQFGRFDSAVFFFFSSRRRHTRFDCDWSSDVCSSDLPDIDIDFEHEKREQVLQYLYDKYGRARAGLAAEVITYRARSAVRDVGKALGQIGRASCRERV